MPRVDSFDDASLPLVEEVEIRPWYRKTSIAGGEIWRFGQANFEPNLNQILSIFGIDWREDRVAPNSVEFCGPEKGFEGFVLQCLKSVALQNGWNEYLPADYNTNLGRAIQKMEGVVREEPSNEFLIQTLADLYRLREDSALEILGWYRLFEANPTQIKLLGKLTEALALKYYGHDPRSYWETLYLGWICLLFLVSSKAHQAGFPHFEWWPLADDRDLYRLEKYLRQSAQHLVFSGACDFIKLDRIRFTLVTGQGNRYLRGWDPPKNDARMLSPCQTLERLQILKPIISNSSLQMIDGAINPKLPKPLHPTRYLFSLTSYEEFSALMRLPNLKDRNSYPSL